VCAGLLFTTALSFAGDWPGFRGPTGLGYTEEKDLPLKWNGKTGENVIWKVKLTGVTQKSDFSSPGHACPIVWGDRIFILTSIWPPELTDEKERRKVQAAQHVVCYRAADGKELWDTEVPPGNTTNNNVYHGYTVPTPATDGKLVYAVFCSGVVVALDFDGKIVWREELPGLRGTDSGFGTSPVLYKDVVIVPGFGKDSGLRALDKKTGKLKWEHKSRDRNVMSTPALLTIGGKRQLVHYAGGAQGIDPDTGETLWFCRGLQVSWSSPAYGGGLLYVDEGHSGKSGAAVDPTGTGDVSKTNVKWKLDVKGPAGASAIVVGDYVYRVCEQDMLRCWKMSSGEVMFEEKLQRITPSASPIATPDGRIYFAGPGRTYVIKAGPNYELLATNDLEQEGGSQNYTTPAIADGRIYIKGRYYLWCIGKK
jgi:outer membrane protein assembly factor BamB